MSKSVKTEMLPNVDQSLVRVVRHNQFKSNIWRKNAAKGPVFYLNILRSFEDLKTGQWKESQIFVHDDLMDLTLLLHEVHDAISRMRAAP